MPVKPLSNQWLTLMGGVVSSKLLARPVETQWEKSQARATEKVEG